ncbi:MAG: NAD-dependent epimerase/dehydratase family protein [Candidatus Krumholzibacteria bacterium]|nr:NAD-dependent epimerase/dehydratase family protein [Candidatus Krumholzibacteria bacterium]
MKTLVTGAAGFIGSHLTEALLARGAEVVGIDSLCANYDVRFKRENLNSLEKKKGFSLIEGDLNELDLDGILEGVDYVFHLAAWAGVRDSWDSLFDSYVDANIRATQRLCEAARNKGVRRFVYASSSSVYGETQELPMSETHPTCPVSPYGVTKLSGEALCLLYRSNFGLPVVALRFFTVFGPRQRPDMAFHRFIRAGLDEQPVAVFGNGTQTRDFTFVSDIVEACTLAMEYDGDESVFNVGGGTRIALNAALDIISGILPRGLDVRYEGRAKGDVTHTYADISLARGELGYAPKTTVEEGLAMEAEWLQATLKRLIGD